VVVISEFGRTFRENGDKGTDHGHGSIYWVLGGAVKGGRIAGPQVKLAPHAEPGARPAGADRLSRADRRHRGAAIRPFGAGAGRVFPGVAAADLQLV
jgi:uncharacterized protein (DUF1501 family)